MRTRSIAALSIAAASVLLLAGCTGAEGEAGVQDPSATPVDLCSAAAEPGDASDAVEVTGEFGVGAEATFDAGLEIADVERTVVSEGDGEQLEAGDYINYALTAYDAETGEELGVLGYTEAELLPQQISPDSVLGSFFGCATVGSRVVATLPASDSGAAAVYVLDLLSVTPLAAWGEEQDPVEGMPTVELDETGAPTITIPDADAPTEVELAELKVGDGPVVESGDTVMVQYTGVKWSDGTEFDSSWTAGAPATFQTTGVVEGFQMALEGYTVGSQVLVVIPPAYGYGASEGHELQEETLVFVVDILATQHPYTS